MVDSSFYDLLLNGGAYPLYKTTAYAAATFNVDAYCGIFVYSDSHSFTAMADADV